MDTQHPRHFSFGGDINQAGDLAVTRETHTHTLTGGGERELVSVLATLPLSLSLPCLTVLLTTVRRRNTRHGGGGRRRRGDEAREPCLPQAASSHNNSFHRFTWRSWRSCRYCRCSNIGQWAPLSGLWDSGTAVAQCSAVQRTVCRYFN